MPLKLKKSWDFPKSDDSFHLFSWETRVVAFVGEMICKKLTNVVIYIYNYIYRECSEFQGCNTVEVSNIDPSSVGDVPCRLKALLGCAKFGCMRCARSKKKVTAQRVGLQSLHYEVRLV